MHTTQDIIKAFLNLTPEQQEEVREFVNLTKSDVDFLIKGFESEYVREENYSEKDIAILDQIQVEASQGINMSGPFEGKDAINYLRRLRKAKPKWKRKPLSRKLNHYPLKLNNKSWT